MALNEKEKVGVMVAQFEAAASRMIADVTNVTWAKKARTILNVNAYLAMVDIQNHLGAKKLGLISVINNRCLKMIEDVEASGNEPDDLVQQFFLDACQEMAGILKS